MSTPKNDIANRMLIVCQDWQKQQPKKRKGLQHLAQELDVHVMTIYRAIKGYPGIKILDLFETKFGYAYEWLRNGTGPRKSKEVAKVHTLTDIDQLKASETKIRQDHFFKEKRVDELEKKVARLEKMEIEFNELKIKLEEVEHLVKIMKSFY